MAAGYLPMRIRATGSTDTSLGDSYLSSYNCSFTRHCLNEVFKGDYDFLDALISQNSCDHVRRLYDILNSKESFPFMYFLKVPHLIVNGARRMYKEQVLDLKGRLETHLGQEITSEALRAAIKTCNQTRRLIRELYELRKGPNPLIKGSDVLRLVISSTAMPKEQFNKSLSALLKELKKSPQKSEKPKVRLMMVSAIFDDPSYLEVIEELGGEVVTDYCCFGTRGLWQLVDETIEDPLEAIVQRYMDRPSCPRIMEDHPRRFQFIMDMAEAFGVDGIICERLKFCDLWGGENYLIRSKAKERGVPVLLLEREYQPGAVGQLKNRIQAFLELIEEKKI